MSNNNSQSTDSPFNGLTIDFNNRSLSFKGKTESLHLVPFSILMKLFNNVGQTCSHDFLHQSDNPALKNTSSVRRQIINIRKVLRELFSGYTHQAVIATVRGEGYILTGISSEYANTNFAVKKITVEGKKITLMRKDHDILLRLYDNFGSLVSKENLGEYDSTKIETRTVDTYISRLNIRLKKADVPIKIISIYGAGYAMQWCNEELNQTKEKPIFTLKVHPNVDEDLKSITYPQLLESDFAFKCA